MGRRPRIEYDGAYYHVIQRGDKGEHVFREDRFKAYFLKYLIRAVMSRQYVLHGYVIMDNHYHLLLQTPERPLSRLMHALNSRFAGYYNWSKKRRGHVFQGRYRALLILEDQYLLAVLRYIHHNPVKAGLCTLEEERYPWSSDQWYRKNKRYFTDIDLILNMLSENRSTALSLYRQFMLQEANDNYEQGEFIGEEPDTNQSSSSKTAENQPRTLEDILQELVTSPEEYRLLRTGSRQRTLTHLKQSFITEGVKHGYTFQEIGSLLSKSASAVQALYRQASTQGVKGG